MTGYRVRVPRDGRWASVDIDELTNEELDDLSRRDRDSGWAWAKALARWIRDHVQDEDADPCHAGDDDD